MGRDRSPTLSITREEAPILSLLASGGEMSAAEMLDLHRRMRRESLHLLVFRMRGKGFIVASRHKKGRLYTITELGECMLEAWHLWKGESNG